MIEVTGRFPQRHKEAPEIACDLRALPLFGRLRIGADGFEPNVILHHGCEAVLPLALCCQPLAFRLGLRIDSLPDKIKPVSRAIPCGLQ